MIQWVKDELRKWGYAVNRKPSGWPPLTLLGRIIELGPDGAMASGKRDFVPKGVGMVKALEAHRIVLGMPFDLRCIVFVKYVERGMNDLDRRRKLNLSRTAFYAKLDQAHYYYLGRVRKTA